MGGGGGVIRLRWALFGVGAKQARQPRPGLGRCDGKGSRRGAGRAILPARKAFPQPHGHAIRSSGRLAERRQHEPRPAPAGRCIARRPHARGEPGGVTVGRQILARRQPRQQRLGHFRQCHGGGFLAGGWGHVQGPRQPGRGRGDALCRADESEKFQQVQHRHVRVAQAFERGRAVHHQGHARTEQGGGVGRSGGEKLSVLGQQHSAAVTGDQGGKFRQEGHSAPL
jgi:hypothetical protein